MRLQALEVAGLVNTELQIEGHWRLDVHQMVMPEELGDIKNF